MKSFGEFCLIFCNWAKPTIASEPPMEVLDNRSFAEDQGSVQQTFESVEHKTPEYLNNIFNMRISLLQ